MGQSNISATSYQFKKIELTNHAGITWDIGDLIQSVEIVESVYTSTLTYEFSIVDAADFFNLVKISGNEKINFVLAKHNGEELEIFEKECYVVDIPLYSRQGNNTQIYKLSCISKHGYLASIVRVSKKINGSVVSIIKNLIEGDLDTPVANVSLTSAGNIKGIIPNMNINEAIDTLLERAYDELGYKFFVYETLFDGIRIESFKPMLERKVRGVYKKNALKNKEASNDNAGDPHAAAGFNEDKYNIIDLSSELGFSKLAAQNNGVYSSNTLEVDTSKKTYKNHLFKYNNKNIINTQSLYSSGIKFKNLELSEFGDTYFSIINKSSLLFDNEQNYNSTIAPMFGITNSIEENIQAMVHSMTVPGNPELSSGSIVDILLPKPIDPALDDLSAIDAEHNIDRFMSGKYLVINNVHSFEKGVYKCIVRIVRDSTDVSLNENVPSKT